MKYTAEGELRLMTDIFTFKDDPEEFVRFVYPWKEPKTPLEKFSGPDGWHIELCQEIRHHLQTNREAVQLGLDPEVFQAARASGHGIGKSAGMSWVNHWFLSTRPGATAVTTANTEGQLIGKTWPELSKWFSMALNSHWFDVTATRVTPQKWFANAIKDSLSIDSKYYYAAAVTWNAEAPEAFAGTHSQYGTLFQFDEASTIPACIWETTFGAMTDFEGDKIWLVYGNPTENSGPFFECFHKHRKYWRPRKIDSRTVKITNKKFLQQIVDRYGEDHDVTRVRVRGEFPKQAVNQFISTEVVHDAQDREVEPDLGAPLILGVDVARYGDNDSVLRWRQGRDARSIPARKFAKLSTTELANEVAKAIDETRPDAVFVDESGVGGGVVDQLKGRGYRVIGINPGGRAEDPKRHFNMRCQMWDDMAVWMGGGAIDDSEELETDLISPTYKLVGDSSTLRLETKEEMRKRGLISPDDGDSLGLTFAQRVARRDMPVSGRRRAATAEGVGASILGN